VRKKFEESQRHNAELTAQHMAEKAGKPPATKGP
jgi:hypothetical protein